MSDDIGDATYRLYADIFPRIADSFSEQARAGLTTAMEPVQRRMNEIAKSMGDTAGLEFGNKFRSRVDEAIRSVSGTVRISLDLDTSSVYAKLDAIRATTADNISQTLSINTSGLDEAQSQLSQLDTTANITVRVDQASYDAAKARLKDLDTSTTVTPGVGGSSTGSPALTAIQARLDSALAQISARDEANLGQIKAKGDAALSEIQTKDEAALGQISAKGDATRGEIQAKNDSALALIQARNDAALQQIQARSDAASKNSSGGPSLFATSVTLGATAASGPAVAAGLAVIPVAFAAIGAAAEHSNSQVASSFSGMRSAAQQTLQQGFQPLIPVFTEISGEAKAAVVGLEPVFEQASRAAAPLISTISQGFIQATVIGVGGFANAMKNLQPIANAIASGVQGLAQSVGDFLQRLNTTAAAQGLALLFRAVDSLLPVAADLLNALMPLGNALLGLVPTIADLIHGGLDVLVPLIQAAAVVVTFLSDALDHLATPVGAATIVVLGLVGGYQLLNAAAGLASKAMAALGIEVGVAAAPFLLVAAGVAALAYGLSQLINPDPVVTSIDSVTGSIKRLGVEVGRLPPDVLKALNNTPDIKRGLPVYGASSDFETGTPTLNTDAQIAADNLLQTDLVNRTSLTTAATQATQAYSDAQYQQAASARAVDAASRGVAAAQQGLADAQSGVLDAIQAVHDAQTKLTNDELAAKNTVLELTEARKAAAQALVDLNLQLKDQAASNESASIALFDAQQAAQAAGIDTLHGPVGLPTAPVTAQNEAQQKLQLALVQAQNQYNDSINAGGKLQDTANQAFAKGVEGSDLVVAAQKAIASANQTVAGDLRAVGNAQDAVVKAQRSVINAKQAVVDAVQAHTDALRGEAAAARATQQAYTDMVTAQAKSTISTDLATQAGRDNYKQAQDLIAADVKLGLGSADLTQKFANQESQLGLTKQQIFDTAQQTGQFTDNQLAQMAQQIGLTGGKVGDLNVNLSGTKIRLGDLDGVKVNFDVNGVGTLDLNSLYASLGYNTNDIANVTKALATGGGSGSSNPLLHADGGPIYGPGGPRDDLVLARLSAGEHVWTADEVQKAGGHHRVEALRHAIRGYAGGGAVTPADARGAAMAVARAEAAGTAADTAIAISAALGNHDLPWLPSNGKTSLSFIAPKPPSYSGAHLAGVIPQGQHLAIIDAALAADHIANSQWSQWEIGLNTLIGRESGWNPSAINLWDSNAKAGHPSQGLGQTIPGTFEAYRNKSLVDNILDPVANVAAVINYINSRYHGIGNVQQANPALPPKGYDRGGWLTGLGVNTSGRPEAVLTADESAGLKAAVRQGPVRLDDYSIAKLAQAMILSSHERPIEVTIGSQPGLGLSV